MSTSGLTLEASQDHVSHEDIGFRPVACDAAPGDLKFHAPLHEMWMLYHLASIRQFAQGVESQISHVPGKALPQGVEEELSFLSSHSVHR